MSEEIKNVPEPTVADLKAYCYDCVCALSLAQENLRRAEAALYKMQSKDVKTQKSD
jgi:hypothetical protein